MTRTLGFRSRSERGAAAVEFGLVSVVLLTLLIGIIQAALWLWAYQVGSHSAREGARAAAVDPCNFTAIEARVQDRADEAADDSKPVEVVVSREAFPVKVGNWVKVQVKYTPNQIPGMFTFPDIDKSATARVENVPAAGGC